MPRFATRPEVFPPVVPPAGSMGDVPMFAFCDPKMVLAWTPPDEFKAGKTERRLGWRIDGGLLGVELHYVWDSDPEVRRARVAEHMETRPRLARAMGSRWRFVDYALLLDQWEDAEAADGPARIYRSRHTANDRGKPFVFGAEYAHLVREVSDDLTVLVVLNEADSRRAPTEIVPAEWALGSWRRLITGRGPACAADESAVWYHEVGLTLPANADGGSDSESLRVGPSPFQMGQDSEARLLPPKPLSTLDVEKDIANDLRLGRLHNRLATSIDVVSRDVPTPGLDLDVIASYEILVGPEGPDPNWERPPIESIVDPEEREERIAAFHPGMTYRAAFARVGRDRYLKLHMCVGGRAIDGLERWWAQACARLWLGDGDAG